MNVVRTHDPGHPRRVLTGPVHELAFEAALAESRALRVSCLVQREHQPPAGFEETDTPTPFALVWKR